MLQRHHLVGAALLILLFMVDTVVATSWLAFHSENRTETLWSYSYDGTETALGTQGRAFRVNGSPYFGDALIPLSQNSLDIFGRGLVFYFKTLEYQNVTYHYTFETTNHKPPNPPDLTFSLYVDWTYEYFAYDGLRLVFVVILNFVLLVLWVLLVFTSVNKGRPAE